jgi:hypothetical protein
MEKDSKSTMSIDPKAHPDIRFGINHRLIPKQGRPFSIFFTLRENRRTPDPALPEVRPAKAGLHPWRLGSGTRQFLQQWGKGP